MMGWVEVIAQYVNVRERAYLTFLREHYAGYKDANKYRIKDLNQSVVHGSDSLADAIMFLERRLINTDISYAAE